MKELSKLEKLNKILSFVENERISAYKIAQATKISEAGIGKILNKLSKNPQERTIDAIFEYLFSNENEYKTSNSELKISEPKKEYKPEGKIIDEEQYPTKDVFVIPIKGRGGLENSYFDEVMFKDLETEALTIKDPSSNGSKWFKIEVEGVSMDDGSKRSLSEGDWAYCRSIGKQYWKDKFHAHKYDIFCFFHNERGIIFKKIKKQDLETGELTLTSLHEDKKRFPDFKIKVSECSYICNVIKVLSEF